MKMLYVACEVKRAGGRVDEVKVLLATLSRANAGHAAEFGRVPGVETTVLPLTMAREGAVFPKPGDVLGVMVEASGPVAVAATK
jgi:hypothetical protein